MREFSSAFSSAFAIGTTPPVPPTPVITCSGFKCRIGTSRDKTCVEWQFVNGAYVAAITICDQILNE